MNGVGAGFCCGVENLVKDKVGLGGILAAEGESLVCQSYERRVGVWLCIHSDGGDASVARGADHADCNLTAVSN